MILTSSSPIGEHAALALASAGGVSPLVRDLGLCLVAAGVLSVLFVRLRIPAIAALLVAGVVLGPAGLEAIADRDSVDVLRHAGVAGAEVIVSTVPDELLKGVTNEQLVRQLRARWRRIAWATP